MTTRTRLNPDERRDQLVDHALALAVNSSYLKVSFRDVAERAKLTKGAVIHHFKSVEELRAAIMDEAVYRGDLKVVAEGLVHNHPRAMSAPEKLKREAANYLLV